MIGQFQGVVTLIDRGAPVKGALVAALSRTHESVILQRQFVRNLHLPVQGLTMRGDYNLQNALYRGYEINRRLAPQFGCQDIRALINQAQLEEVSVDFRSPERSSITCEQYGQFISETTCDSNYTRSVVETHQIAL